jgi:hypothetical protein
MMTSSRRYAFDEDGGAMRKLLFVLVALASAAVLSSCALLPFGHGGIVVDDSQQTDAAMKKIAAAMNDGDAAGLKALFSKRALEQAPDIDAGLDYFLSLFPNGGLTWERDGVGTIGTTGGGTTTVLQGAYIVSADGKKYWLTFADFTVNDHDPDNVGIYMLGATPYTKDIRSGASLPFFTWAAGVDVKGAHGDGYPGVYVPE